MAMAIESKENSRINDICDVPIDRLLTPIRGYEDQSLLPLAQAIKPVSRYFHRIDDYLYLALRNCQHPTDGLDQQESASIHLYTMQFRGGPSLYRLLNQSLRAENRDELIPWFSYLKLFLTALRKLPSECRTIWRGVKNMDLTSKYRIGSEIAWWGVSSCTTNIQVLQSNTFLGQTGERTIFSIECFNGKSIGNHSYYRNKEEEIILMPGSYFEVIGQLNPAPGLHIIQLKEILPPITFIQPSSTIDRSSQHSQVILDMTQANATSTDLGKEISPEVKWKSNGVTIVGGNGLGNRLNQLYSPSSVCIDDDQTIYVADGWNHRILEVKWNDTYGRMIVGGKNQLNEPSTLLVDRERNSLIIADYGNKRVVRLSQQNLTTGKVIISDIDCLGIAMDKNGALYVSDWKKNDVRRWKRGEKGKGTVVAGGNGQGDQLNQLNYPTFIFVDDDESVYVSDVENHRVMKWRKNANEGLVVAGGNREGDSSRQLSYPQGLVVDPFGHIYVAEWGNHRVTRWWSGAKEGSIVLGGNGSGQQSNQLHHPMGLSFDQEGNLYVADFGNHRIQKFEVE